MSWPPGVCAGQRAQHRAGVAASLRPDLRGGSVPRCTSALHSGSALGRHLVPHLLERLFLIALLLQLCGRIPGVIYGIYVVTQE